MSASFWEAAGDSDAATEPGQYSRLFNFIYSLWKRKNKNMGQNFQSYLNHEDQPGLTNEELSASTTAIVMTWWLFCVCIMMNVHCSYTFFLILMWIVLIKMSITL